VFTPAGAQRRLQAGSNAQLRKVVAKYAPKTRPATHSVALVILSMRTASLTPLGLILIATIINPRAQAKAAAVVEGSDGSTQYL
jgi:hypothetical protein